MKNTYIASEVLKTFRNTQWKHYSIPHNIRVYRQLLAFHRISLFVQNNKMPITVSLCDHSGLCTKYRFDKYEVNKGAGDIITLENRKSNHNATILLFLAYRDEIDIFDCDITDFNQKFYRKSFDICKYEIGAENNVLYLRGHEKPCSDFESSD
jgi:hypothetical protein